MTYKYTKVSTGETWEVETFEELLQLPMKLYHIRPDKPQSEIKVTLQSGEKDASNELIKQFAKDYMTEVNRPNILGGSIHV